MSRTGPIRQPRPRLPRQNSIHHRPKSRKVGPTSKISHRFVRIHHKKATRTSESASRRDREQLTPVYMSHTPRPADRNHTVLFAKNRHSAGGEATAVPNPIPDAGFRSLPTSTNVVASQPMHSVPLSKTGLPLPLPTTPPTANRLSQTPSIPTFMPLTTSYDSTGSSAAIDANEIHPNQATTQAHKLSIPLIVLLAVGCALLVIGIFSLIKYYFRPARRPRPRPSLPVLNDPFVDDKEFPLEDSPIFGGKERMSNGNWSWSHYPQPEIAVIKPPSVAQPSITRVPAQESSYESGSAPRSPRQQGLSLSGTNWRIQSTYSGHGHTQSVPTVTSGNSPFQASLQQLQGALSRTVNRVSASFYPSSPQNSNVGLTVTRSPMTTYTADGSSVLKRSEPRPALDRTRSNSVVAAAESPPASVNIRNSKGSSYNGSEIGSPSVLPYTVPLRGPPSKPPGRSRIKSSYYNPNSYPRISNPALASDSNTAYSGIEHQSDLRKSDAHRGRDTQALTHALGLSSDASKVTPPSPQPTLYPDDSLSVVESKRSRKPQTTHKKQVLDRIKEDEKRPSLPVIATAMDASAALGSLMLMDFTRHATRLDDSSNKRMSRTGSSKVLAGAATTRGTSNHSPSIQAKASTHLKKSPSRSSDKPPSIPLPELLPSLEQMGLEHSNPQAYADYKSPTYSIYGLYGSDRKSGVGY
ncbi:hypothetical protein H0H87_006000 [Tephrocybe sp. NHM501043]|nr:hypothetical protein H0H87_006000 [Tephrocybe sp. NHM501043]